jgi:hypothetical protein
MSNNVAMPLKAPARLDDLKWADIVCRVSTQAQAGDDAVSYD